MLKFIILVVEKKFSMNDNVELEKVLILLSSYNGERFIEEQLNSLLNQTLHVDILIRDDGSTDHTVELIQKYADKYENITLITGKNIGFVQSFNTLLMNDVVENYRWIAFCDQDDVWMPQKMEIAVKALIQSVNPNLPLLYCSNLIITDENLQEIGKMHPSSSKVQHSCIFVQNFVTGCTVVFNNVAMQKYRDGIGDYIIAHDYLMHCLCKYFGEIIYDPNSYICYRQHGDNTIGSDHVTYLQGAKNLISDLINPQKEKRVNFFAGFLSLYGDELSEKDRNQLLKFIHYRKIHNRIYLFFNPRISGYDFKTTLAFKIRTLIGRMY